MVERVAWTKKVTWKLQEATFARTFAKCSRKADRHIVPCALAWPLHATIWSIIIRDEQPCVVNTQQSTERTTYSYFFYELIIPHSVVRSRIFGSFAFAVRICRPVGWLIPLFFSLAHVWMMLLLLLLLFTFISQFMRILLLCKWLHLSANSSFLTETHWFYLFVVDVVCIFYLCCCVVHCIVIAAAASATYAMVGQPSP